MNASTSISTRIHGSMRARASIIEVAGRVSPKASSELLQRGERVLSTARTKGNFAYKGISVTAVDSCQNGWGVETPIPRSGNWSGSVPARVPRWLTYTPTRGPALGVSRGGSRRPWRDLDAPSLHSWLRWLRWEPRLRPCAHQPPPRQRRPRCWPVTRCVRFRRDRFAVGRRRRISAPKPALIAPAWRCPARRSGGSSTVRNGRCGRGGGDCRAQYASLDCGRIARTGMQPADGGTRVHTGDDRGVRLPSCQTRCADLSARWHLRSLHLRSGGGRARTFDGAKLARGTALRRNPDHGHPADSWTPDR